LQVTFNINPALLHDVDAAAKERGVSRSGFIADCLHEWFEPKPPISIEVDLINKDLTRIKDILTIREVELNEAKEMAGRHWLMWKEANDRLVQYQLPPPRRSFFAWLRRSKKE
jgi:hypothetical protein